MCRFMKKLNVVDFLIILFLLAIVVGSVIYFFPGKKAWVDVVFSIEEQPLILTKSVNAGDSEIDDEEELIANITNVKAVPSYYRDENAPEELHDFFITAKILANYKKDRYFFKGEELKVNKEITIVTEKAVLTGNIIIFKDKRAFVQKNITARFSNKKQWVADNINLGDKEVVNGVGIAEVLNKTVLPAEIIVTTDLGEVLRKEHPINKDIVLEMEIRAEKIGNDLVFNNGIIKVGKQIYIDLGDVELSGEIISVK